MLFSIEQSILAEETLANLWSFAKSANVSLYTVLDQQSVEKVQRKATKLVRGIKDLSYVNRLCNLNLPSLACTRGDLIYTYMYKLAHNLLDMNPASLPFRHHASSITRGDDFKIFKSHATCLT